MNERRSTKIKKAKMLDQLCYFNGIVKYACEATNISRKSHYEWMKIDEEYAAAVDEINSATNDYVEDKLFNLIRANNPTAIMFYLRTKGRGNGFGDSLEITGKDGGAIQWNETKTYKK